MPGKYQYDIELKSNVAKLLTDMKEVQDRLDTVEGKEYKIKLNVDEKKLSNVISNLEKMLDSLGKGTGDFKQFENLSKELSSIVSEVQNLSKAFGKVDDSGAKTLLSSIQNIDKSLSELSQHILNVNKNMSNIGSDTNGTVKQVENIGNAYDNAAKSAEKLADAQSKIGNKSNISVDKEISTLEKTGSKFESQAAGLAIKPDDQHQFSSWTNNLDELNAKIEEYNSKVKYLKENNITDENQIAEVKSLRTEIENTIKTMSKTPQAERGWTQIGVDKAIQKMNDDLKKNSNYTKETKRNIEGLITELKNIPDRPLSEVLNDFYRFKREAHDAKREGKAFFEIFKEKVIYGGAAQLAGMVGFYDVINVIRQAGEAVIDLNTNITELAKVSEASVSQIYDDFNSYADIAKEVGGTISDTISATADWSRNGYNIPDSKELAEVAMIYKNVGDGIDIDQANEYLISTLRGFSLEAKDAMDIIDSINEVANNEPISSAGIGEALQRSAAAFNVANTSLQESIALVTSTNSVLQSPEKVGSMWTTVSARIRGAKTELEDAGLETDGMVESTSKLQAMIKGMTGFDILEDDQKTFKSIYDIIIGIGEEFQNLSGVDQAALLEALAGKRQSNALAATLNNIDLLKKAYGEATNAEGSAMAEQEKYQQSIQYSIDRTKASLEELANDFISSDFLKGLIDFGDKLINILDLLIDKFGVLGTTAIIGGGILGGKNIGREKCYPSYRICL